MKIVCLNELIEEGKEAIDFGGEGRAFARLKKSVEESQVEARLRVKW